MRCSSFRAHLRRAGPVALPEDARRHAEGCPACDVERRAASLLALGSGPAEGAPRPGFPARLRARLAAEGAPPSPGWADAVGLAARPALGLAAAILLTCAGLYATTSSGPPGDDLALLAEGDPVVRVLVGDSPGGWLTPDGG